MPRFPAHPPPSERCGGQEVRDMEAFVDLSSSSSLELNDEDADGSWSPDAELQGCGQLERRWVLWHDFMKEHAHLDAWLRLAEQAVGSSNHAHVSYVSAKEDVRKFERLRCEAGARLVQLDGLTRRNRTLTRLFEDAVRARLLALARECGRRWDDVSAKLESITRRLKLVVSEWAEFEAEREELVLWLADLDVRLCHLTGSTCEKLRQLQSFQQSVCVISGRVNVLLQRGEALMQRSDPTDAQRVESGLMELLRRCSLVYNNIARTHTRLLSMRLVFEEDWILSPDSGCPSETLLEEEGALDFPATPTRGKAPPACSSPVHLPPPPPSPSSPSHEHLGLEWDPSVDIGRSVSRDDADSSYFSTGLCHRDGVKRRSYLSSLGSQSDISHDITNQEVDLRLEGWLDHAHPGVFSPHATEGGGTRANGDQWATSTPDRRVGEPVNFDGGRVRAWLGVQSPAPSERRTSCSKAVQTDEQVECYLDGNSPHSNVTQQPLPAPSPPQSHDLKAPADWMKHRHRSNLQAEEDPSRCEEAERLLPKQSGTSSSTPSSSLLSQALLCLLLTAALTLLACLLWGALEPLCHCSSRASRGFHLTLRYVNGPPPT